MRPVWEAMDDTLNLVFKHIDDGALPEYVLPLHILMMRIQEDLEVTNEEISKTDLNIFEISKAIAKTEKALHESEGFHDQPRGPAYAEEPANPDGD